MLLVAEIFLPSFGILFALALVALVVGVTLAFNSSSDTGVGTLDRAVHRHPHCCGRWQCTIWPKTPLGRRFVLNAPQEDETLASTPLNQELEHFAAATAGPSRRCVLPASPTSTAGAWTPSARAT